VAEPEAGAPHSVRINRDTWVRLGRAVTTLLRSEVGGRATALFVTMFLLLLAVNGMNVVNSYVGRDFMTSIESHDPKGFVKYAILYAIVFGVSTLTTVLARFAEERLDLLWRRWLTNLSMQSYLGDRIYYRLQGATDVTNPDQRISEDIRFFSTTALSFVVLLTNGALTAIAFSGVLWAISPVLFGVAYVYSIAGTLITWMLARSLVNLNYAQSDREADLRSDLIHLRENADPIALLGREERLRTRMLRRLEALVANTKRVIAVNRNVGFFTTGYQYAVQLIPILIVAPLYFRGQVEFGVITQSAMAFSQLVGAISILITQFQSISSFAAVLSRLSGMAERMDQLRKEPVSELVIREDESKIAFEGLQLVDADKQPLVKDLGVEIAHGTRRVSVIGNAAARFALFRASAGLWPGASGTLLRPPGEKVLFVTERPYLPPGTLREILLRNFVQDTLGEDEMTAALRELGVDGVLERTGGFDTEQNWSEFFALGEQQLVAVARLLLAAPLFAFLDRPSSAFDEEQRQLVLRVLENRKITALVFEDCEPCDPCDAVLDLKDDATWEWRLQDQPRAEKAS
jgi:vitamin B12/bleomycin/antimicrobial peptide transport system ATP-binding/permease protein